MNALAALFDVSAVPPGTLLALGSSFWFALGAALMSFCGVAASRVPRGESIFSPPSHCDACGRGLSHGALIPVLGYFLARGRCASCGAKVPTRHPAVEFAGALLFALAYLSFGARGMLWFAPLCLALAVLTHIDFERGIVPDILVAALAAAGFVRALLGARVTVIDALCGAAVGGGALLTAALLAGAVARKPALGGGDVKLMCALGLWLGVRDAALALLVAVTLGGSAAAVLLARSRARGERMPFVPWISLGSLLAALYGGRLLAGYLSFVDNLAYWLAGQ